MQTSISATNLFPIPKSTAVGSNEQQHAPMLSKEFTSTTEPELGRKTNLPNNNNVSGAKKTEVQNSRTPQQQQQYNESRRAHDVPSERYQQMLSDPNLQHYALLPAPIVSIF